MDVPGRGLLAGGNDLGGLHGLAGLVAPRILGVGDHGGDVGVRQLLPRRHRAVGRAAEQDPDLLRRIVLHDRAAVQRLDRARALAVGAVAGRAVGGINLLAARDQLGQRPHLAGVVGLGLQLLELALDPLAVLGLADHLDVDRHVGVFLAAQLGALAVEVAGLLGAEPGVAHEAGDRVLLDRQRRHHPGVDHVVGGGDDADLAVHRHHQRVVDLEQVVVGGRRLARIAHLAVGDVQRRQEADALALALEVVVAPFPLVAGGLDREVGVGRVLHRHHALGGCRAHADHDQQRRHRPGDLHCHALVEVGRLGAAALAVLDDRIEHRAEHGHEDHRAHHHQPEMKRLHVRGDAGGWRMQVDLVDCRAAGQVVDGVRQGCGQAGAQGDAGLGGAAADRWQGVRRHHLHRDVRHVGRDSLEWRISWRWRSTARSSRASGWRSSGRM